MSSGFDMPALKINIYKGVFVTNLVEFILY